MVRTPGYDEEDNFRSQTNSLTFMAKEGILMG
jgi:hypothetical protein